MGGYDEAFVLTNLVWALTIVVLPFSTQVIAEYDTERLSVGLYIGTIAVSTASLTLMSVLLHRRPALRRAGSPDDDSGLLTSGVTTALVLVALVLGVALPGVNFLALLLLLLTGPCVRLVARRRARG